MQSKDIIRQPLTTEWVIAHPNAYVHRQYKSVHDLPENKALVVTLADYNTYADTNYTSDQPHHPSFVQVTTDRTKRFKVKYVDGSGNTVYRIVPASEFVGQKHELEARWAEARIEYAKANAERLKREEAEKAIELKRRATEANLQESVHSALADLFGESWNAKGVRAGYIRVQTVLNADANGNPVASLRNSGDVEIPVDLFLRMVERFANAE